jgi:histidine triad (HIT) family protein
MPGQQGRNPRCFMRFSMPTRPDPTCIFCKIASGQIPSFKVYEDDIVFAFVDIGPIVQGHVLVIPKAHYSTIMEIPSELLAQVSERLPKLTRAVLAATGRKACHVLINNGAEASQSVHHLHYHILPRYEGDGYHLNWPTQKLDPATGQALAEAVNKALG